MILQTSKYHWAGILNPRKNMSASWLLKTGVQFVLSDIHKLFGVTFNDVPSSLVNKINHVLLIVKMCISKYKFGSYNDILHLFKYELKLRGL